MTSAQRVYVCVSGWLSVCVWLCVANSDQFSASSNKCWIKKVEENCHLLLVCIRSLCYNDIYLLLCSLAVIKSQKTTFSYLLLNRELKGYLTHFVRCFHTVSTFIGTMLGVDKCLKREVYGTQ